MKQNIGDIDRIVRFFGGMLLLTYALKLGFPDTGWNWIGWIGVLPIVTAIFRVCPAYSVIGLRTSP